MTKHHKEEKRFSLKDQLFNEVKVTYLASQIESVYPSFPKELFIEETMERFPELELKQRIYHIAQMLKKSLPQDYRKAVKIILAALPPELDPTKTDNDFGDFILAPFSEFIVQNGCSKKHFKTSTEALGEITKRFSAEDAIRYFINAFSQETYEVMKQLVMSENYHQRRLASEGSRPSLPWSQKIHWSLQDIIAILDFLYTDPTRYVTRSVANNLNDISKIEADLVLKTLQRWKKSKKQSSSEMDFIIKHSLRTLLKNGNVKALAMLGYSQAKHIALKNFQCSKAVRVGEDLHFSFDLKTKEKHLGKLRLEYAIYYRKANGKNQPKVFKIKEGNFQNTSESFSKKQSFQLTSTRKLYTGKHFLTLIINGKEEIKKEFSLLPPS